MNPVADDRLSVATAPEREIAPRGRMTSKMIRTRNFRKRWRRAGIYAVIALCLIVAVAGFVDFAERIANAAPPENPHADAIVVLTGGSARIDGALKLLAEGRASRLLISGVNPQVTADDLAHLVGGEFSNSLDCCVDLGHEANDTVGNAVETRLWTKSRGFSSLIVVTSDYHMPRSMTELASAMPDIELTPFPVSNPARHLRDWWHDPSTLGLLIREYGKYLFAKLRHFPAGAPPDGPGA